MGEEKELETRGEEKKGRGWGGGGGRETISFGSASATAQGWAWGPQPAPSPAVVGTLRWPCPPRRGRRHRGGPGGRVCGPHGFLGMLHAWVLGGDGRWGPGVGTGVTSSRGTGSRERCVGTGPGGRAPWAATGSGHGGQGRPGVGTSYRDHHECHNSHGASYGHQQRDCP